MMEHAHDPILKIFEECLGWNGPFQSIPRHDYPFFAFQYTRTIFE